MFGQLRYYIYSISIFLSLASTIIACDDDEIPCRIDPHNWCCPHDETCGTYKWPCNSVTTTPDSPTPPLDIPSAILALIIVVPLCICITCLSCCIRSRQQQRLNSSMTNTNAHPYQQHSTQRPPRHVHVRPTHNVNAAPSIHNGYEAPPPSYEAAISNLPPAYASAPPPSPPIATIEGINSRV